MRLYYQREIVDNQQLILQKLTQEKFLLTDSSDIYEKIIWPLLLSIVDNNIQIIGFLKNHLLDNLYI